MRNLNLKKNLYLIIFFIALISPALNINFSDTIQAEKITSDLSFYEINPCKVSLLEAVIKTPQIAYQDHYFIKSYDYSSYSCFGRVSGVTQVGDNFYIAIGGNNLLSFIYQSLIWSLLLFLVPKNKQQIEFNNRLLKISQICTSFLITFTIFAETRFYQTTFYLFDHDSPRLYIIFFLMNFLVLEFLIPIINKRSFNFINYLPFHFLFINVFSGFNIHFFQIILIFYGFYTVLSKSYLSKFSKSYSLLIFLWLISSRNTNAFLDPDKLRGFTSSIHSLEGVLSWSLLVLFSVNGVYYLLKNSKLFFNLELFIRNSVITSYLLLILGYFGAHNPIVNYYNYTVFGQQKYGTDAKDLFLINEWGVRESWRGFYPSAESIGEFYGVIILLIIFQVFNSHKITRLQFFSIPPLLTGLYFSHNRTVGGLLILGIIFLLLKKYRNSKFLNISVIFGVILSSTFMIIFKEINIDFNFYANSLFENVTKHTDPSYVSSYTSYLVNAYDRNETPVLLSALSILSYIFNRSELWGIFIARYNPTFSELLIGSGPNSFGQVYGEIEITDSYIYLEQFILPHSSVLSFIVFFGFIGLLGLTVFIIYQIIYYKDSSSMETYLMLVFIFVNLFKSDSINYMPSILMFVVILSICFQNKNILRSI
jgi:hypothetical protein